MILILLFLATNAMAEPLLNCIDDPKVQAIVCEKVVKIVCPYDERKKCYQEGK